MLKSFSALKQIEYFLGGFRKTMEKRRKGLMVWNNWLTMNIAKRPELVEIQSVYK